MSFLMDKGAMVTLGNVFTLDSSDLQHGDTSHTTELVQRAQEVFGLTHSVMVGCRERQSVRLCVAITCSLANSPDSRTLQA